MVRIVGALFLCLMIGGGNLVGLIGLGGGLRFSLNPLCLDCTTYLRCVHLRECVLALSSMWGLRLCFYGFVV